MKLFIQIRDGQPYEHPIMETNFLEAFPDIDVNNLPQEFAVFERVECPSVGQYEVIEGVTYQWQGNVVKDVWSIRQMTDEEKIARDNEFRSIKAKAFAAFHEQSGVGVTRV